jgi:SAM-dependent methyltransferase
VSDHVASVQPEDVGIRGANPWDDRAESYRTSEAHSSGPDLDLLVEWASGARTALDVATGGGHVARRLREAGLEVVTCDPSPGMRPDVICRAEDMPFADESFDVVACRIAAHHFADVEAAMRELGRVGRQSVLVVDNLHGGAELERAEKLRDPSHVRAYSEEEWRGLVEGAGLRIEEIALFEKPIELEPWLARTGCHGEEARQVRSLLTAAGRIRGGRLVLNRIALKGVRA